MTPRRPSSASLGMSSEGNVEASSHSITCGAISLSANLRTVLRSCCCSSVRENSTKPHGRSAPSGQPFIYTIAIQGTKVVYPVRDGWEFDRVRRSRFASGNYGGYAGAHAYGAKDQIRQGANQERRIVERRHHVEVGYAERF